MQLIYGDLFDQKDADAICITTNGFVKSDGSCVMGRGCAKKATQLFPGIEYKLGKAIRDKGNNIHIINYNPVVLSFPVKSAGINRAYIEAEDLVPHMRSRFQFAHQFVPGWALRADMDIIKRSLAALVEGTNYYEWQKVVLPRPGCGAGDLKWDDVRPVLADYLDDRFYVITFRK